MLTDDSEFAIAHEIWAAAQLAQGEGIEDGANRITAILERLASEVCSAQNAESERQDGLSLTDATQTHCPACEGRSNGSLVAMPVAALKALQAKVAEQSAEIGRLTKERDEYNSAWQRSGVEYRKLRDSLLSLAGEFK